MQQKNEQKQKLEAKVSEVQNRLQREINDRFNADKSNIIYLKKAS